ncbi:chromosome assembly protein [Reticulomyxa filosa]|uniref:Chromosome assembly protein n=1 Tax=Reticulomyxa filosa TaxID=46433 RepID=X6N642_RETFI|nr:chromosome assembly protein [Reticulomyxa filosa]|eukprot:ETO21486.1 chromosome assembly protein [Reticulomyxa filosa]
MSQQPQPRLVLTKIELENFKSYYGRRIIGPFHKVKGRPKTQTAKTKTVFWTVRFSSIVGPNGSGKSNVIDALLFVFGKRASKIRLKKISELVHNSSDHPDCNQAKVTVFFQEIIDHVNNENKKYAHTHTLAAMSLILVLVNTPKQSNNKNWFEDSEDEYTAVEGSQFSICRIATKRNQSQYFINGNAVTRTDVVNKLISKGVDLSNNRFLILQGEVESISLMKPKGPTPNEDGLLEYLEDIIGSNQFVEQIEKAKEGAEVLNAEVEERLNRVKLVEKDRDKLESAKNEAQEFVKKELQLWKLSGIKKQISINQFQGEMKKSQEALAEKLKQLQHYNDEISLFQKSHTHTHTQTQIFA